MNAQNLFQNPRVLLYAAVLLCAALIVGCQDQAIPVALEDGDIAVETSASKGKPGGGDGNGFTVALTGGLVAAPQDLGTFKENKRQISGKINVFTVGLSLGLSKTNALDFPGTCSFSCDDAALANNPDPDADTCDEVYVILADAFVSPSAPHPTVATSGYTGLNIGFDPDAALDATVLSSCPFTGIAGFEPPSGGGVLIRNCYVTYVGEPTDRTFRVEAHSANTVSTGRRFETDGNEGLGPQDYRASLACPLEDAVTVTFAPK